ncbi:MAG: hypothetical protein ACRD96_10445, partial [Bryobacteraceae bacterium]
MKRSFTTGLWVLLVFVSGAVVGGFGHRVYSNTVKAAVATPDRPSPEEWRRRYVEEIRTRLTLDEKQVVRLQEVLDATRQGHREIERRTRPEYKAIQEEQVSRINA